MTRAIPCCNELVCTPLECDPLPETSHITHTGVLETSPGIHTLGLSGTWTPHCDGTET